ncbi:hypothetical protein ASE48_09265 [Mycobacterium sp. Root265]|uniref:sensor domain-containing protein n=1 Tax=Mycobacterium sp. Root265 TaxID=1736504 RepID=UPI00070E739A|nr:sensor domain-containing protein [Mycobacterium sp. Root265]KRD08720.1 hypothetical protein ASE48_09265 [Mycobacterium sp. Root265]
MADNADPLAPSVHKWIGVIGLVIAPTTLVTGLCYYFGYTATRKMFGYLGIDTDAVGFTTNDYVARSTGVLFVAALVTLLAGTAVLGLCVYLARIAESGQHASALRTVARILVVVAAGTLLRGVVGVLRPAWAPDGQVWLTPVTLAVGACLVMMSGWVWRLAKPKHERAAVTLADRALVALSVAVLVLALFWSTNLFATKAGEVDGINAAGNLWSRESTVILDTSDRLFLPKELVVAHKLTDAASPQGETFRYECLRPFAVRGDSWVLIPANWRPQFGYAIIVDADATHRITLRTIKDAPDRIGNGDNVRRYWPCPEVVPTASGVAVQAMLPSVTETGERLGIAWDAGEDYKQGPAARSPDSSRCAGAVDTAAVPIPESEGFENRFGRRLVAPDQKSTVDESVLEFRSPSEAWDYLVATRTAWSGCVGSELVLAARGPAQRYRIDEVVETDRAVFGASSSPQSGPPCWHGVAAISNIVVDVRACGTDTAVRATTLVDHLRDRFPRT